MAFKKGGQLLTNSLRYSIKSQSLRNYQNISKTLPDVSELDSFIVDVRSDTVTKPSAAMREAIFSAPVGDDVYGEDPTIHELQSICSKMFGKEAALFIPTGTMGNLIALMTHCQGRGLECVLGDRAHIFLHEQGGMAQIAGVHPRTIANNPDGTFSVEEMEFCIRRLDDIHQPWTRLVSIENTHNFCGGKALPIDFLKRNYETAKKHTSCNLQVHMDGARLMNAAVAQGLEPKEITQYCDTVTMCFSKGLGAPVGSILSGPKKFIDTALRVRKSLGGGMRQGGILAAAAVFALKDAEKVLRKDHSNAKRIAIAASEEKKAVEIDVDGVHTNIIILKTLGFSAADLCERVRMVTEEEKKTLNESIVIKMLPFSHDIARIVTHQNLNDEHIDKLIAKLKYVLKEFTDS